jgi:hypothetical protein
LKSFIAIAAACLLLFASTDIAAAQSRTRRTTPQKRRTTATNSRFSATEVNSARLRVADQIKTLNRFLYLYGRASKDIEATGSQVGSAEVANRSKNSLVASIGNVREGLDQLEAQFRLSPALQSYYRSVQGVSQRAAEAESLAAANQLDRAGRALIEVVNQLTDVLIEMQ